MDKEDNILFIGNGFDLHNGMKTGYSNYLDSLEIPEACIEDINLFLDIHVMFNKLNNMGIIFLAHISHSYYKAYIRKNVTDNIITFNTTQKEYFETTRDGKSYFDKIQKKISMIFVLKSFSRRQLTLQKSNSKQQTLELEQYTLESSNPYTFISNIFTPENYVFDTSSHMMYFHELNDEFKFYILYFILFFLSEGYQVEYQHQTKLSKLFNSVVFRKFSIPKPKPSPISISKSFLDNFKKDYVQDNDFFPRIKGKFTKNLNGISYVELIERLRCYEQKFGLFPIYLEYIRKTGIENNKPFDSLFRNNNIPTVPELNTGNNWIDIENILYHNQFEYFQSTVNADHSELENKTENMLMYRNFLHRHDGHRTNIEYDFEEFKLNFSKYVEVQQNIIDKNEVEKLLTNLNSKFEFTKVFNFNYSNYINPIFKKIDDNILVDNIHGSVNDRENIVFGSNHQLFLDELVSYNEKLRSSNSVVKNNEYHYKLTKIYQVLKLSKTRNVLKIKRANSLTILGHSIGKQDFEYFHSIINTNPEEIELNIIWSTYKNANGIYTNNLESLTEAVYEMLESYKNLYKDITVHRMILENRIKFIHLDEFIKSTE